MIVTAECECHPTEEKEKVCQAMHNIFPEGEITGDEHLTLGKSFEILSGIRRSGILQGLCSSGEERTIQSILHLTNRLHSWGRSHFRMSTLH